MDWRQETLGFLAPGAWRRAGEREKRERDLGERVLYFLGLIKPIQVHVYINTGSSDPNPKLPWPTLWEIRLTHAHVHPWLDLISPILGPDLAHKELVPWGPHNLDLKNPKGPQLLLLDWFWWLQSRLKGYKILKWKSPYALQGQNRNFTKILIW